MLLALAAAAFAAAFVVGWWLFPLGSINHDEPMYRFNAELLRAGDVTLPGDVGPLAPWYGAEHDGRFVLAYAPVWPAVLAVGDVLGSMRVAVGATAAAAVLLMAALGRELFGRWKEGLVAAGILLASPLFLVQTGTYLSYLLSLVLALALVLLVLGALRRWPDHGPPARRLRARLVGVGAVWGLAVFARPYDALLVGIPLGVLVLARARHRPGMLRTWVTVPLVGAAPPLALLGAHSSATMGSPTTPAFTVTGSQNSLLFGRRGIFESGTYDFTPEKGGASVLLTMAEGPLWVFGGVGLLVLAALGLRLHHHQPGAWAVVGVGATFTLGYGLWWSSYSIARMWPGQDTMGTFYHLPVLIPLGLFGAAGLVAMLERRPPMGWAAVAVLVVLTAAGLPTKVDRNLDVTDDYRAVQRVVDEADLDQAVLFMADRGEAGFSSAAPFLENDPGFDDPVLYAEDRGPGNLRLLDRMPDRTGARLRPVIQPGDDVLSPTYVVERLEVRRGPQVSLDLAVVNPVDAPLVRVRLVVGDEEQVVVLDRDSGAGERYEVTWDLSAESSSVLGASVAGAVTRAGSVPVDGEGTVVVQALFGGHDMVTERYERRYPYLVEGGEVRLLAPGRGRVLFQFGDPVWIDQQIDHVLAEVP